MARKTQKKLTPEGDPYLYYVAEGHLTTGPPAASPEQAEELFDETTVRILGVERVYPGGMDVTVVWEDDLLEENPRAKLQTLYDGSDRTLLYATDPSWVFGLDDGKERQFGVLFEILDMYDATGEEEFETYPWVVEASIVADKPSAKYKQERYGGWEGMKGRAALIEAAYQYGGGVPITHTIATEISGPEGKGLRPLLKGISAEEYEIFETTPHFGTVAAQRGPGVRVELIRFAEEDAARKYVENMMGRLDALGMMIGFLLDRPINMVGDTGWSVMERWVYGP